MTHSIFTAALLLALISPGLAQADGKFEHVAIRFEQNATDRDAEIVFEVTSGTAGLATLKVVAPDGRTLIDFKAPDSRLGLRHLSFESPEPKNDGSVQADFPAGEYTFTGSTVSGVKLRSKAVLSHRLPSAVSFVRPRPDQKDVSVKGLQINWSHAKNPAAYIIVVEEEQTDRKIEAKLSGTATSLAVPDGFLAPGTEYKLAIGAVTQDGNTSFAETAFTTAGKK
jgi:hypothetical protein